MINFFRNLRQKALTGNNFSKYLIYAIGEIFLVVIGILIALWVSNWSEEKRDQKLGDDLLVRIHRDLVRDTVSFRQNLSYNVELREEMKGFLVTLYNGVETIEQAQELSNIYDKALDQVFSPNDNTYQGMVSSGTMGLIRNQELKEEIIDLYTDYDQKSTLLLAINDWMGGVAIAVDTQTDFIKFGDSVNDLYTTPEMLNETDFAFLNDKEDPKFKMIVRAISATAFNQNVRNAYYKDLIARCDKVLRHIQRELE